MRKLLLITMVVCMCACKAESIKLDPMSFNTEQQVKEVPPAACKSAYDMAQVKMAIVNFTNNSTFDAATVLSQQAKGKEDRAKTEGAATGTLPGNENPETISKQVNAKLCESIEDGVETEFVQMGGVKMFSRKDIQKVITEQQFQNSGLVDDRQLAKLGKLAGVKYIVTGSVNNVVVAWKSFGASSLSSFGIGAALTGSVVSTQEGWHFETDVAIKILDVETGEIVFQQIVKGKEIIGKIPVLGYDALIGGIKKAASKGIEDVRPQLSKWFALKGYILQTRTSPDGSSRAALINIGLKSGLKEGDKLVANSFQEVADPFDERKKTCDITKLPLTIEVTNQLQNDKAWVLITGEAKYLKMVKAGQLVERSPLEGQTFMKRMGY